MTAAREELERLALACEQATGADRLMDADIAIAVGWQAPVEKGICGPVYAGRDAYEWHDAAREARGFCPPKFTVSLDAAMTLVPEGWHTQYAAEDRHSHSWRWELRGGYGFQFGARASMPALALCAAALRSRALAASTPE